MAYHIALTPEMEINEVDFCYYHLKHVNYDDLGYNITFIIRILLKLNKIEAKDNSKILIRWQR